MQLNPYLHFDGRCEEAFRFYEQSLGGKIQGIMHHDGSPAADCAPADWKGKVMHACLSLGDQILMGCDAPPDRYQKPQGFSAAVQIENPADAERIFAELAQNGTVTMPIQETFWAVRFGMVVDRFGIPWMVNCTKAA